MAKKIGIYALKTAANEIIRYCRRNEQRIRTYGGEALWSVVDLLISIAAILVSIIDGNENASDVWQEPLTVLSSQRINEIHAAFAAFNVSNDVEGV